MPLFTTRRFLGWLGLLLGLGYLTQRASAQPSSTAPLVKEILPKSPIAASLGRFGEVPVSLYTGVPSIEVPLFTLRSRTLSVPVRVQYHGGGVRVDDIASWVGMGWALQAGGTITHTVRGLDDLDVNGYILANCGYGTLPVPRERIPVNCGRLKDPSLPDYYSYIERVYLGLLDTQPDIFSFNFGSYAGKIVFNQQGQYFISPAQPLQVEFPTTKRHQWRFTDETGTQYIFRLADAEYTTTYPLSTLPVSGTPSAWYLSTIRSLNGDSVQFAYNDYRSIIEYKTPAGNDIRETELLFHSNDMDDSGLDQRTCGAILPGTMKDGLETVRGKLLRQISCATAQLTFYSSFGRADYPSQPQLDSVQWTSRLDPLPRRVYRFGYTTSGQSLRHTLSSIQERGLGIDGRWVSAAPYRMDYASAQGDTYPGSPATDMWGFYNGKTTNENGFVAYPGDNIGRPLKGANREASAAHVGFGLLQRLTYPTGGTSDFSFESHDFGNISPQDNYSEQTEYLSICDAYTDKDGNPACGNRPQYQDFTLDYEDDIQFTCSVSTGPTPPPDPHEESPPAPGPGQTGPHENDIQVTVWAETLDGNGNIIPGRGIYLDFPNTNRLIRQTNRRIPAGRYRFFVEVGHAGPYAQAYVMASHTRHVMHTEYFRRQGGGTRIKRITTFDGLDHGRDKVKEYFYTDSTGQYSSGRLQHEPVFNKWVKMYNPGTPNNPFAGWNTCTYLMRSAHDVMAATGTVNGSEVGYDRVTLIERGDKTATKSVATFRNEADQVSVRALRVVPQEMVASNDNEQNGQLLRTDDYAVEPEADPLGWQHCRLVRQVCQTYGRFRRQELWGLSLAGNLGGYDDHSLGVGISCWGIGSISFRTYVGWYPLVRSVETLLDAQGQPFTTTTQLEYDTLTHLQLTRRLVTTSTGKQELTRYKYAADYAPSLGVVPTLLAAHYVGRPLEEQRWQLTPTDSLWLAGKITTYAQLASGAIVPVQEQQARLAAPSTQLPPPRRSEAPFSTLAPSASYEARLTLRYKPNGQLLDQRAVGERPSSLLWGYQDTHLIAHATNASLAQVASTSFEPAATGRWLYDSLGSHREQTPWSGRYGYRLDATAAGAIRSPQLPAGTYELTIWCQGTGIPQLSGIQPPQPQVLARVGEWRQYRYRLVLPTSASVQLASPASQSLLVDELRLYPVGAHLTSYTYDPLDTLTSQTGPDGRTLFYEYDGLGRLVRTRDEQGRILSQQQYHYAGGQ